MKLSSRGRFFNEDDLVEYDVLDYDIDATFSPEREWLEGAHADADPGQGLRAGRADAEAGGAVHRADRSRSDEFGRLLFLRVRNQNSVVVNLPSPVARDLELTLDVDYQGPHPEPGDRSGVDRRAGRRRSQPDDMPFVPAEPNWLFSNRSYWYPQGQVTDYATANDPHHGARADYTAVAERRARRRGGPIVTPAAHGLGRHARSRSPRSSRCVTSGVVVSKIIRVDAAHVALDIVPPPGCPAGASGRVRGRGHPAIEAGAAPKKVPAVGARNTVLLSIAANRRQEQRARETIGHCGRDPAFLCAAHRRCAVRRDDASRWSKATCRAATARPISRCSTTRCRCRRITWRNDPAVVQQLPGVLPRARARASVVGPGGRLAELPRAVAQRGLRAVLRRALRTRAARRAGVSRRAAPVPPLGDRPVGSRPDLSRLPARAHQKRQPRLPRAWSTTKARPCCTCCGCSSATTRSSRGCAATTRRIASRRPARQTCASAMEAESGRSLERFFQRWIFESGIPRIRYSTTVEGQELVVRFEQASSVADTATYDAAGHRLDALCRQDRRTGRRRHRGERREAIPADRHAEERRSQRRRRIAGGVRETIAARNGPRDTETQRKRLDRVGTLCLVEHPGAEYVLARYRPTDRDARMR